MCPCNFVICLQEWIVFAEADRLCLQGYKSNVKKDTSAFDFYT